MIKLFTKYLISFFSRGANVCKLLTSLISADVFNENEISSRVPTPYFYRADTLPSARIFLERARTSFSHSRTIRIF
jgi:hypothetical protein